MTMKHARPVAHVDLEPMQASLESRVLGAIDYVLRTDKHAPDALHQVCVIAKRWMRHQQAERSLHKFLAMIEDR